MRELVGKSHSEALPLAAITGLGMLPFLVVALSVIYNTYGMCIDCIEINSGNEDVNCCKLVL